MRELAAMLLLTAARLGAATFTVTNSDDSGAGSLRQAILDANANPVLDTIGFNIPGAGVHTISPLTELPAISDPVTIDGYSQPGASPNTDPAGFNGTLLIEISGASAGPVNGLNVDVGPSVVRGLVINRFAGTGAGAGNGIRVHGGGSHVEGNFIGTDPGGTIALVSGFDGVRIFAADNTIGGATPGARNVISGQDSTGVNILGSGNVIQGNFIGIQRDGLSPLGNRQNVAFQLGATDNILGGTAPGEGNVIAYSPYFGVLVDSGTNNAIRGNSIHDNASFGIDVTNDGPNFNDPQDADAGTNLRQNFPIVREVEHLGPQGNGSTRVAGKFNSAPSTTFDLDFYSNPACSNFPRELLEGETWLGESEITTDANGDAAFDVTLPVQTEAGARISVTATDPAGNTSEFSTGCGGGLFCPNNLVTRRQMAVFLLKTKYGSSYVPPACTGVFDDVSCPGAPAVDFIERLAAEQITGGCSTVPPLYCPDNSANRGQMATFITKTFNLQ